MKNLRSRALAAVVLLPLLFLTGCLFHTRTVPKLNTANLQTATQAQLIDYINQQAAKIQSINATVEIRTSVGGAKKGKVTDYTAINGYLLLRRPDMLRLIGQAPVVRNTLFDMASNGREFRLSVPLKSKFYVGHNTAPPRSSNALENLRPDVLYDAILLQPIDQENEIAVLSGGNENFLELDSNKNLRVPGYNLLVVRKGPKGWYLSRRIVFSRTDLKPHRQLIYDQSGNLVTDVLYNDIRDYNGIDFAQGIELKRPEEEYDITLKMLKLQFNAQLRDEQFVLQQPPGTQPVQLDQPNPLRAQDGQPAPAK
jgi:outer membrane lipoprotein-sorting protein